MTSPSSIAKIEWRDALGRLHGEATAYCAAVDDSGRRSSGYWPNYTYVCPKCGHAWMHEIWTHSFHYQNIAGPEWKVRNVECRFHGGGFVLDHLALESCGPKILQRELALYFALYDKEHKDECSDYPSYPFPSADGSWELKHPEPDSAWSEDSYRRAYRDWQDNLLGLGG